MHPSNRIVHGLWIGEHLSPLERLTMTSFLAHGHQFWLWTYGELREAPPAGVQLHDAAVILPAAAVFRYRRGNEFGHGKGSLAGFSDIFRYKLLYEYGGWWTDMDVTCLRPLDFTQPYVFRGHDVFPVVGNIMKCPAGSPLMSRCYEEARREVHADNDDWLKPIRILNRHIDDLGLGSYLVPRLSNPDRWEYVDYHRCFPVRPDSRQYVFHWMHEEWRARGVDKSYCYRFSLLDRLLQRHEIDTDRRFPPRSWALPLVMLHRWIIPLIPRPVRHAIKRVYLRMAQLCLLLLRCVLPFVPPKIKRAGRRWLWGAERQAA